MELFAGDGNVGKSTRYGLVATAQLDIKYGTGHVRQYNAFDLGSPAGLPFLALICLAIAQKFVSSISLIHTQASDLGSAKYQPAGILCVVGDCLHFIFKYECCNVAAQPGNSIWQFGSQTRCRSSEALNLFSYEFICRQDQHRMLKSLSQSNLRKVTCSAAAAFCCAG